MKMCFFFISLIISLTASAQDTTYKEMTGKYKFPAGTVIEEAIVTLDNGILNMNSAQGTSVLEKMKGDTFNVVSFNGIVVFKRDESRKITGVHVDASGYVMDGEKEVVKLADYSDTGKPEDQIAVKQKLQERMQYNRGNYRLRAVCIYN